MSADAFADKDGRFTLKVRRVGRIDWHEVSFTVGEPFAPMDIEIIHGTDYPPVTGTLTDTEKA